MVTRPLRALFLAGALYFLYFFHLTAMGVVGPDEPRYASIGRAMARSGDWITPRLWGQPWFEKPALLYWMTGAAFRAGLSEDLAPRLPVALLGAAFLLFYAWILRREFGAREAAYATGILATSAGWLAYSHIAITDLPLAATFSAAMLLLLPWLRLGERRWLTPAAAMLALAALAKGPVALALALPALWCARRKLGDLASPRPLLIFIAIALPWYALCTLRNGAPFLRTFFWEHNVGRFVSDALQHPQPFWYFVPILMAALFPWTPLLIPLFRRDLHDDPRLLFLLLWLAFGFVFFSAGTNKLPHYLLPLIPAAAALCGIALARARTAGAALFCCSLMLSLTPAIRALLPVTLANGSLRWSAASQLSTPLLVFGPLIFGAGGCFAWLLERRGKRDAGFAIVAGLAVCSVVYLKIATFPEIDRDASARSLWREVRSRGGSVCVAPVNRAWRYGLNYYSETPLPDCPDPRAIAEIAPGQPRPTLRLIPGK